MTSTVSAQRPIVILGAGINGAALARELVLNQVPVWLIDTADVAAGTTAYSSRLIHGGLRYLEYGEFDLVKESLAERNRLLRLAPQFVRPLRLTIPLSNRWGGLALSAKRFLGLERSTVSKSRGLWLVRMGLSMYDFYAADRMLPRHETASTLDYVARHGGPAINTNRYPWLCSYSDAQVAYPERFTLALVQDARELAAAQGTEFRLFTYHRARLRGTLLKVIPVDPVRPFADLADESDPAAVVEPALVVNATGAWVDETLAQLRIKSPPLIAGTKGTHFFTTHSRLKAQLAGQAVYGEARDGRPVFILPLAGGTLVGTTDDRYSGPPEQAVATEPELRYLLDLVNDVMPDADVSCEDIDWHYAGIRPLPRSSSLTTSAVTRRHFLVDVSQEPVPVYAIVGGKLTTCRSLAEASTRQLLERLGLPVVANSQDRPLPGGEDYPASEAVDRRVATIAREFHLPAVQVQAIWSLCGTRTASILADIAARTNDGGDQSRGGDAAPAARSPVEGAQLGTVAGTPFPRAFVRWVVEHEWPRTLEDLIERRLMLLYHAPPTHACLEDLAQILVDARLLATEQLDSALQQSRTRLKRHFGFRVSEAAPPCGSM